ncbi:hypothetical protein [Nocardioides convexus]|uniref:hypothetical protein n=1 Tax=Nocardioides convexus TaxID=2712224 RepID=UPI0024189249|nr:hypothetical protein [Nocardioides convexus]
MSLGIAFQDHALLPWRSVTKNIRLPFEVAGRPVDKEYVEGRSPSSACAASRTASRPRLSGGMRQRVSIARALAPQAVGAAARRALRRPRRHDPAEPQPGVCCGSGPRSPPRRCSSPTASRRRSSCPTRWR